MKNVTSIKYHENSSSVSGVVPRGMIERQAEIQTELTNLTVPFANLRTRLKRPEIMTLLILRNNTQQIRKLSS